jgi:hypothetical protein
MSRGRRTRRSHTWLAKITIGLSVIPRDVWRNVNLEDGRMASGRLVISAHVKSSREAVKPLLGTTKKSIIPATNDARGVRNDLFVTKDHGSLILFS